jgi:hypothetical protein
MAYIQTVKDRIKVRETMEQVENALDAPDFKTIHCVQIIGKQTRDIVICKTAIIFVIES